LETALLGFFCAPSLDLAENLRHPYIEIEEIPLSLGGNSPMSIVRVGLAETKKFSEGYDAIFGKKKAAEKPASAKKKAGKPKKKSLRKK